MSVIDPILASVSTGNSAVMDSSQELVEQFVLAAHGNLARVKDLHSQHPGLLNTKWEKFDENALEAAGHTGRRDIADYLLTSGAPLTIYAAAMLGTEDRVAAFLQANPLLARTPGVHGFSVLYHAALSGNVEIAELLSAQGGEIGQDAALHAATSGNHLAMATWLLSHGANVNGLNFEGKTPLQVANESGRGDLAALLTQHGGTE
jgi:ankyrin repeat protein